MWITLAGLLFLRYGQASCVITTGAVRFTAITQSQSLSSMSASRRRDRTPAAQTRMSREARVSNAFGSSRRIRSRSVRSRASPVARWPESFSSLTTGGTFTSVASTFAPSAAKRRQISAPWPPAAPVTTAVFPFSSSVNSRLLARKRHQVRDRHRAAASGRLADGGCHQEGLQSVEAGRRRLTPSANRVNEGSDPALVRNALRADGDHPVAGGRTQNHLRAPGRRHRIATEERALGAVHIQRAAGEADVVCGMKACKQATVEAERRHHPVLDPGCCKTLRNSH